MSEGAMRLARVHGPGDVRLDEVPVPRAGPGEVIVQVRACGICGSDLSYIAQGGLGGIEPLSAPLPIGHELAGVVETVGAGVAGIAPGMRVAVNPDRGFIGGGGSEGGMAPFLRVSAARLGNTVFPLADHVTFAQGSLAEPLSVALHALRVAKVTSADKVAVLGAGPIGLCTVAMLRSMGVQHIAIFDRVSERLDRARALGAEVACNVETQGMAEALTEAHGGGERFGAAYVGTDVFIDCAGAAPALTEAFGVAKYRARIAVVALYKKPVALDLWRMMANEIAVSGSIADDRPTEFGEALDLIARGTPDLSPLISHTFDFGSFDKALDVARNPHRSAKVMLTFAGDPA